MLCSSLYFSMKLEVLRGLFSGLNTVPVLSKMVEERSFSRSLCSLGRHLWPWPLLDLNLWVKLTERQADFSLQRARVTLELSLSPEPWAKSCLALPLA